MAFENLRSQHPLLLQYLTDHHYSSPLIDTVRREITRIIDLSDAEGWKSYADIFSAYEKNGWKKKSIDDKRYILRLLERFDIHNEYPIRAQRKSDLFANDRFDSLPTEFQEFAVMCRKRLEESGRKSSTVSVVIGNLLRFLELLHLRGCNSFSDVTETDVIAFFVTETGRHIRGATAKKMLVTALNTGKEWKNGDCARIMPFVPLLQPARKAIQYLTHEEVEAVRFALTEKDVPLSMRDKAMGCILLYMGLRQCDVINLRLNDIDWDIRTCEARELHVEDVDLKHGILTIRHSKGRDQHYIVLHDSMNDLMRRYDKAIRQYYPQRSFFFSSHRNRPYTSSWVKRNFRIVWDNFSDKKDAVAYALRHNYATTNINKWIGEGLKFEDKLTYLSKSMGHMSIDSTTYYYSIVPCLADILSSKTEDGFNEIVPEVLYEE